MNAERLRRAEAIFLEIVERPRDRWEAELNDRCAGDDELRREVRSLLEVHEDGETFLDDCKLMARSLLGGLPPAGDLEPEERLAPGTRIGEYTVGRFLGSGGMGAVYVAEQQRPRRTVALKLIRTGAAARGLLRRFEHEAEVLGRLQHAGIAQIFEAGTAMLEPGDRLQPFIAMELVEGPPITEYATSRDLGVEERLALLARVCDAVHHAHQRGVIHRDLKPANILVDPSGQPKVLDFGVARAADPDLQLTTIQTHIGQLIGTLPYMSPEQVLGDPREVDTRTDVYALGVILYQLLAGRLPIDVSGRAIPDAIRLIREQTHESLSRVSRVFRGEIETIVARALDKDRDRRYQSAAALAEDLRRFLAGEPILAKQDSAMYVLRKAIRRYQAAVAGISLAVIGLVLFSHYAWRQSAHEAAMRAEAQQAAAEADRHRARADSRAAELARHLRTSLVERGRLLAQNGNLRAAEELLWPLHRDDPSPHSGWALWDLYQRMPCVATLSGHEGEIWSLTVSDDESRFASGAADGRIIVWDAERHVPLTSIHAHDRQVVGLAFLPGGDTVISAASDGAICAWSVDGGRLLRTRMLPGGGIPAIAVFDGLSGARCLAAACADGQAYVVDAETFATVRTLGGGGSRYVRIAADARGDVIAAGSESGTLHIWSPRSDTPLVSVDADPGSVASIAVSRDGRFIATGGGSASRWIRTWRYDPERGVLTPLGESRWTNGTVRALQFSDDGSTLLAGGYHRFEILRADTCEPVPQPIRFNQPTMRLCWMPLRRQIVASEGPHLRVWDDSDMRVVRRFPAHQGGAMAVIAQGELVYSAGVDGAIRAWRIDDEGALSEAFQLEGHHGRVRTLHLDAAGRHLVSAGMDDSTVVLWDLESRRAVRTLANSGRTVFAAKLAPDASWVAVSARDGYIRIWSTRTGELIRQLDSGYRDSINIALGADGAALASFHAAGGVLAWDTATWQRRAEMRFADSPWSGAFIPGTGQVAIGGWNGTISRWSPTTGAAAAIPAAHNQTVTDAQIAMVRPPATPGAAPMAVLVTASTDGSVCLSDPESGLALAALQPAAVPVNGVAFARDSTYLIGAVADGTLAVIDVRQPERYVNGNRPRSAEAR